MGQQCIGRDVFAGDIAIFQYRNCHPDFVGAFD
jgi:hypothetical protein